MYKTVEISTDIEQYAVRRYNMGSWYLVGGEGDAVTGDVSWNDLLDKPTIPLGANLTEQAAVFGQSARSGNADTWARSDHYHALPSAPTIPTSANIDNSPLNSTVTHGSAQTWARSDHRHAIPVIPDAQIQSDWNQSTNTALDYIKNKPTIPTGANIDTAVLNTTVTQGTSSNFARADHRHAIPTIPPAQVNSDWNATTGVAQILNKPTIPAAQIQSDWNQTTTTALDYIKNKPTIPSAPVQSDWNQTTNTALDYIKNKPTIPAAHSGQSLNFRVGSTTNQLSFDTNDSTTKSFRLNAGSNVTLTVGGDSTNREVTIASTGGGGGVSVANLSGQASAFGQSANSGSAATAARSDHYHALPSIPTPFWSGANTGGDVANVTTPGAYSGNWSTGAPVASWGSLLVLPSDTGTSYRQKIFIQESSNKIWFQSNGQTWQELTGGNSGSGNYVSKTGDTMTGILNIERSAATATESNRYLQLKTTTPSSGYNTLDGMRLGVSNINGTCGGWIQSFNGSYDGGQLTLNPNGGKVETGGGFEVKGGLSVATSIESQDIYIKGTARFGSINNTSRRVVMSGGDIFAIRGATADARSIVMYRGEIYFFMDSNADFDSTAAGFRFALEGTTSAPTLTVKRKTQNGSWTNAVFSNGAFS